MEKLNLRNHFTSAWCAMPASVPHGEVIPYHIDCNSTHCPLNRGFTIRCDPNYILVGYGAPTCTGHEEWSFPVPTCEGNCGCNTDI